MSNCHPCVKVNPMPECINMDAYDGYYLEGLVFESASEQMIATLEDKATGKKTYIDFETDIDGETLLDLVSVFPLMDHVYTLSFTNQNTGNPEQFTITNTDASTVTGCCIEFRVNSGLTDSNGYFIVSTLTCPV